MVADSFSGTLPHACTPSTCTAVRGFLAFTSRARRATSMMVPTSLFTCMHAHSAVFVPTARTMASRSRWPCASGRTVVTRQPCFCM